MGRRISVAILMAAIIAGATVVARGHHAVPDDVFFYLKIADAIVSGAGSTFDGLRPTNGYHPLWMLVCVATRAMLRSADRATIIAAHLSLSVVGTATALLLITKLGIRWGRRGAPIACAVVATYVSSNAYGSELHVSLPLLVCSVLLATACRTSASRSTRLVAVLGLSLGLSCLARLDNVFVAAALGLTGCWGVEERPSTRSLLLRLAVCAGVAALVLAPYLLWNRITFGHFVPISGAIKSGLAAKIAFDPARVGKQAWILIISTWLSVPYCWARRRASPQGWVMAASACGASLHALYVVAAMDQIWTWYFAGELLVTAFVLQELVAQLCTTPARRRFPAALLALFVARIAQVSHAGVAESRERPDAWYLETARWINSHMSERSSIAVCCSPGSIAYYSDRHILALDGLTGDFRFHERAAEIGLRGALSELGVEYVLSMGPVSSELTPYVALTRTIGHGGEGPEFYGSATSDDQTRAEAVGLFSAIARRSVGRIQLKPSNLVGDDFSYRKLGIWKISD